MIGDVSGVNAKKMGVMVLLRGGGGRQRVKK